MRLKPTNIFIKGCFVLVVAFAATSGKKDDDLESDSQDSDSPDSGSLENKMGYDHNVPYLDMYGNLRKSMAYHVMLMDTSKSCVCSPLGALLPLGKLAMGSSSRRYTELKAAIGYKRKKIRKRFRHIMDYMTNIRGKLVFMIANRMYVSHRSTIRSKFNSAVREVFKSGVEKVDFNDRSLTATKINNWVNSQTNGMIKKMIDPNDISPTSSLIIINAIYFRGAWRKSFDKVKTAPFHAVNRQTNVRMMYTKGQYNYFKSTHLKAQIVDIPYASREISMIVVLPLDINGLPALVHRLANLPEGLNDYMRQMRKTTLKLSMPKFRIATDLPMDNIYQKVGLREIFKTDNKVLTKIVKGHNVYVTRSYQKAIFDVDEYGSDGGVVDVAHLEPKKPGHKDNDYDNGREQFNANHPFMFFVVANDEQVFAGIYVGPAG